MEIQKRKLEKVIPYATNPRQNENAISGVVASLKEFGWQQPIVVGHTEVPVRESDGASFPVEAKL